MIKSIINMILFTIIIIIFLYLFLSPDIHGFKTPQQSPNSELFQTIDFDQNSQGINPIMITPSHVHIIPPEVTPTIIEQINPEISSKRGFSVGISSPTNSIIASSIFDIPIEYPSVLSNELHLIDRPGFIFDEKDRKFDSIGEKLCCKIFEQWIYNKFNINVRSTLHLRPDFLRNPNVKNPTKRNNLELDIIYGKIAIEYNGGQHTQYIAKMHNSYDDYLKQVSNDQAKAEICKNMGIELIVINAEVDTIKIDKHGKKKYVRLTEDKREEKIKEKLIPLLEIAYINIST